MTTTRKLGSMFATLALLAMSTLTAYAAATSTAEVSVRAGEVTIGAPSKITFPAVTASAANQVVDINSEEFFWVSDLKAAGNGYYATLSISDLTNGSATIPAANLTANVSSGVTKIAGSDVSQLVVPTTTATDYLPLTSAAPLTILERKADAAGKIGKYGVRPTFKLAVPAYQTVGNYAATLTYTLIEN